MTPQEVAAGLARIKSWETSDAKMRNSFYEQMENRQYGGEALMSAWAWFYSGWMSYTE